MYVFINECVLSIFRSRQEELCGWHFSNYQNYLLALEIVVDSVLTKNTNDITHTWLSCSMYLKISHSNLDMPLFSLQCPFQNIVGDFLYLRVRIMQDLQGDMIFACLSWRWILIHHQNPLSDWQIDFWQAYVLLRRFLSFWFLFNNRTRTAAITFILRSYQRLKSQH